MAAPPFPRPVRVEPVPLARLTAQLGVPEAAPGAVTVTGVAQSSNAVCPGDLYVALPGAHTHGARYAPDAVRRGAVALLTDSAGTALLSQAPELDTLPTLVVDDPRRVAGPISATVFGNPSQRLRVIGITGTNGKTTTAHLTDSVLRTLGSATALLSTVHTRMGDQLLPSLRTTPEAADLQALLALAVERGIDTVTMEVSSHALALNRVDGTRFAVGAFTNLSVDHLDFHADMADYFAAKARLFDGRCEHEIVTIDDDAGRRLAKPGALTVSIRADSGAVWRATDIESAGYGQRFTLRSPYVAAMPAGIPAGIGLPGVFNVSNALLVVAIVTALGADPRQVVDALRVAPGVPGRMERVGPPELPILAVVDYAHAPDGVAKALAALRGVTRGRLICVLGCGGDRDTGKRPMMGAAAARGADLFVATDDNPRSETPEEIRAAMLAGALSGTNGLSAVPKIIEIGDRAAAINYAVENAQPGDTVAVLGKGHEQGQEISGVTTPFDDRDVLAAALREVYG